MTAVTEEAPTMDSQEYSSEIRDSLVQQIQDRKENNAIQKQEADEAHVHGSSETVKRMGEGVEEADDSEQEEKRSGFQFSLDDETWDVDPKAKFKFKADGKTISMTLEEMRDSAAGGIAVRNRMRNLSNERKKLYAPYKDFNSISSKDPLGALKKVFSAIKEVEPDADMKRFLVDLGKQAQSLTQMSAPERKAYELEKELNETRKTLTERERIALVQERKQELIGEVGLTEEQVFEFGQHLLSDPDLAGTIRNESELFDRIEDLADEVHRQQAVISALQKYDPKLSNTDPLVFELAALLDKNPDFDEHDLDDIVQGVLTGVKKSTASRVLSKRQRSNVSKGYARKGPDLSKLPPRDSLMQQILNKKNSQQTTTR